MTIKLLDLPAQHLPLREELHQALLRVADSGVYIMGPEVEGLEKEAAAFCGSRFSVGVTSGTDAILAGLMALGVGPGDEVLTSPFTFFATAGTIARLGAVPVFADILPDSFNIDPKKAAKKLKKKTKCLLPVHLYGQCAELTELSKLAVDAGIPLLEDAAQAIGARLPDGRRAGAVGAAGCLSFFPTKNLGAMGDAGLVLTDDEDLWRKLKRLRVHGSEPKYYHKEIGGNFRIDAMQAAVLRVKLKWLPRWNEARQKLAARYRELFAQAGLLERGVVLPAETWPKTPGSHIYHQFVIRTPKRDALREALRGRGIETEIYYPLPLHLQECFRSLGGKPGDFPEAERASAETLALPIHPQLTDAQLQEVVGAIADFLGR
jgi:dTDP-4-amino-4,6-dideoxygalactose transaminase